MGRDISWWLGEIKVKVEIKDKVEFEITHTLCFCAFVAKIVFSEMRQCLRWNV